MVSIFVLVCLVNPKVRQKYFRWSGFQKVVFVNYQILCFSVKFQNWGTVRVTQSRFVIAKDTVAVVFGKNRGGFRHLMGCLMPWRVGPFHQHFQKPFRVFHVLISEPSIEVSDTEGSEATGRKRYGLVYWVN